MDKLKTLKIVKIGGNVIDNPQELTSFLTVFSSIKGPKTLVHGGGKSATALANQTGVEVQMIEGRRITDAATLELITMVYAGKINNLHFLSECLGICPKRCAEISCRMM